MSKSVALIPNIKFPLGKSSKNVECQRYMSKHVHSRRHSQSQSGNHVQVILYQLTSGQPNRWPVIVGCDSLPQGREGAHTGCSVGGPWKHETKGPGQGRVEAVRAGWGQVAASGPTVPSGAGGGGAV